MKYKKEISLFLILIFQLIPVNVWFSCKSFLDNIHFSYYDLQLQLIELNSRDASSSSVYVTRFFHNKATQFVLDVYKRYTQFLDIRLFVTLMTFVGVFGILLAFWYFLGSKKKDVRVGILILISFLTPLVEVVLNPDIPFMFKFIIFIVPFEILSLYGHYQFLKQKKAKILIPIYFVLIIFSILWLFTLPDLVYSFCVKR
jgi:hypothetical protein